MVAESFILALADLLTSMTIEAGFTLSLTAPAAVSRTADTGSSYRVTLSSILTLTSAAAVGTPVVPVTS